jgi:hypothetical protein
METSDQMSTVGVTDSTITRLPTPELDAEVTTGLATRSIGTNVDVEDLSMFGDDVIRIRLVFDGDDLRQILMVDPSQHEVEWVRATGAQHAMRNSA